MNDRDEIINQNYNSIIDYLFYRSFYLLRLFFGKDLNILLIFYAIIVYMRASL